MGGHYKGRPHRSFRGGARCEDSWAAPTGRCSVEADVSRSGYSSGELALHGLDSSRSWARLKNALAMGEKGARSQRGDQGEVIRGGSRVDDAAAERRNVLHEDPVDR